MNSMETQHELFLEARAGNLDPLARKYGPIIARISRKKTFEFQMRRLWDNPQLLTQTELDGMWEGLTLNGGKLLLPRLSHYLYERRKYRTRWVGALKGLDVPAHILWAMSDPIAVPAVAERMIIDIPGAVFTALKRVGHYPMLEAPERWARAALDFLSGAPGAG